MKRPMQVQGLHWATRLSGNPCTERKPMPGSAPDPGCQKMRFIINIVTTRNNTVMTPPARMKSGTR